MLIFEQAFRHNTLAFHPIVEFVKEKQATTIDAYTGTWQRLNNSTLFKMLLNCSVVSKGMCGTLDERIEYYGVLDGHIYFSRYALVSDLRLRVSFYLKRDEWD